MPRGDNFRTHSSVYAKLVANVTEDGACWLGTERERASYGYVRTSLRIGHRQVKCMAHILMFCIVELRKLGIDNPTNVELYAAYIEFRESGLEIDHECNNPPCRFPGHLSPVTRAENEALKHARRLALPVPENIEHDPALVEF